MRQHEVPRRNTENILSESVVVQCKRQTIIETLKQQSKRRLKS